MNYKGFFIASVLFLSLFWGVPKALAVVPPTFPTCANPQGSVKVSYSEGTHGIPGSTATYTGSDVVYQLSDDTLMQCFCSDEGQGIQTNWWKVASLSQADIDVLKSQGWTYVPNGSIWGLDGAWYMTTNSSYDCLGGGIGGWGIGGGDVLGLATTGNIATVYSVFSLAFILLGVGIALPRNITYSHDQKNR